MRKTHLLMLTYEMDEFSQLFSHQIEVVNHIAFYFDRVTVITGKIGQYQVPANVKVYSSHWRANKNFRSALRLIILFSMLLGKKRYTAVFSHMTATQAAIISPLTKIFRVKHFLWYAHASENFALKLCNLLTNGILTATEGSCPVMVSKVYVIGHSINSEVFKRNSETIFPIEKFVHVGRFDPSKNLEQVVEAMKIIRSIKKKLSLTTFGSPSGKEGTEYFNKIYRENLEHSNWLNFFPFVKRSELPKLLSQYGCFIHAYTGSLDKAVLEATFCGLPVVTINNEYIEIFGRWESGPTNVITTLTGELNALLSLSESELKLEISRRYRIALEFHEIQGWAKRVSDVINS
jgi:glycosyltransferase involved in cell wall biosynthesis